MPSFIYTYSPVSELLSVSEQGLLRGGTYLSDTIQNSELTNIDVFFTIFSYPGASTDTITLGLIYSFDNTNWQNVNDGMVLDTVMINPSSYPQSSPLRIFIGGVKIFPYYMKFYVKSHSSPSDSATAVFWLKVFGWNYTLEQT